jgi:hypothetical protein
MNARLTSPLLCHPTEPTPAAPRCPLQSKETAMKGIFAYFLGTPVVIIIILYLTGVF